VIEIWVAQDKFPRKINCYVLPYLVNMMIFGKLTLILMDSFLYRIELEGKTESKLPEYDNFLSGSKMIVQDQSLYFTKSD